MADTTTTTPAPAAAADPWAGITGILDNPSVLSAMSGASKVGSQAQGGAYPTYANSFGIGSNGGNMATPQQPGVLNGAPAQPAQASSVTGSSYGPWDLVGNANARKNYSMG